MAKFSEDKKKHIMGKSARESPSNEAPNDSKYDDVDIKYKKLKEDDLGNRVVEKVRSDKNLLKEVRSKAPYNRKPIEPRHKPKTKKIRGKKNRQKYFDERRKKIAENEAEYLAKESQHITNIVGQGIRGETSPLYDDIRETIRNEDRALYRQMYSHEKGLKYEKKAKQLKEKTEKKHLEVSSVEEKIKAKKVVRVGLHEEVQEGEEGQKVSKLKHGIYQKEVKLKQGERTVEQKLQYQSIHQPKQLIKRDLEKSEQMEGNEGVQVAHQAETVLKNKIMKPYIRDNYGFDKHHVKAKKLKHKANVASAKAEYNQALSESLLQSNPISRSMQRRNIKKRIYEEKGLYRSPLHRVKDFVVGSVKFIDPLYNVKQAYHVISTAIGAMGLLLKTIITTVVVFMIVIVPVVAIVSVFSIFFDFGENENVEIANMTLFWNEQLTDIRMELIEADQTESYAKSNYDPVDEVRISGSVDINMAQEQQRQVQVIGYITALLQDDLDRRSGETALKAAFDELYQVHQEYADEGWWETELVGYDNEGNAIYEDVWVEYWVLYLSLEQGDIDEYAISQLNQLNEEDRELALLQYEQYQEGLGYGQIGRNPLEETSDWRGLVSSLYGYRIMDNSKELHRGLDIAIPENTPLYAIADGTVIAVGSGSSTGNYVYYKIEVGREKYTVKYMHLNSSSVREGDVILKGQQIALSGNTGRSTGPHLHLEIEHNGKQCNPLFLIEYPVSD
ncbi:M23 family metallopeptidase [Clostridium formicaceticum]|uniref:Murein DD-endopeptidase MepM n=1 Tax=Clostridium formicaceticum TaxID=1497 RepID=A0AAC9WHM3_9CLOT|nr:M23 family metallopeptidase [Clostridium formicaceticum]AOY74742.1 hypothetical protein BJL90_01490 [Clostridium formicaceticum]ARE89128.1 Murein DD-endopeptidase MepM [Clostridium formicaceticum]